MIDDSASFSNLKDTYLTRILSNVQMENNFEVQESRAAPRGHRESEPCLIALSVDIKDERIHPMPTLAGPRAKASLKYKKAVGVFFLRRDDTSLKQQRCLLYTYAFAFVGW
ncbi:hypothetical protein EVAR_18994_1 [Eumeta japonica]|uniref:Uncharacterized protein n=1 Tax=Eumeta variegata TaxID=151549 RepID=A0A4C1V712_EUMVA|nr:hypothetical protein EVAR_18994_1 [Eumeta japonica]